MKKDFYGISTILQVLFLISAYGVQMFSMKKMGMMRYVVYINHQWEAKYPIETLRNISITFLVMLSAIITLYALIKKYNYITSKKALLMLLIEGIMTLVFVFFTLCYSTESYRSYYFTSLTLGTIVLIQNIKIIVCLKKYDYNY
ncbi:hypothetical protein [Tepidibacter aestuarii]|uniref:hypothetical protein n=1 Tax=Tepidibacter aestuarii TaxID=2925782 RepID=UPI0020C0EA00|nr:hypothetical protein [Tepidibacter aestuarii]